MPFFGFLKKKSDPRPPTDPAQSIPPPPSEPGPFSADSSDIPDLFSEFPEDSSVASLSSASPGAAIHLGELPGAPAPPPGSGLTDFLDPPSFAPDAEPNHIPSPLPFPSSPPSTDSAPSLPLPFSTPAPILPSSADILPDFSDEEILEVSRLSPRPARKPKAELEPFPDVESPLDFGGAFYVSAAHYGDALRAVAKLKEGVRKSTVSLKELSEKIADHQEHFLRFAETLNTIQERLISMDNVLLQR